MFHVILECVGVPGSAEIASDITEDFAHRPWNHNVRCSWDGSALRLEADDDYDETGLALRDEFSDAIAACVRDAQYTDLRVVSVTKQENG